MVPVKLVLSIVIGILVSNMFSLRIWLSLLVFFALLQISFAFSFRPVLSYHVVLVCSSGINFPPDNGATSNIQ